MKFNLLVLISSALYLLGFSSTLNAQQQNLDHLQEVLKEKKKEIDPFADQKFNVDLESLGLDNVDEKVKKPVPSEKLTSKPIKPNSIQDPVNSSSSSSSSDLKNVSTKSIKSNSADLNPSPSNTSSDSISEASQLSSNDDKKNKSAKKSANKTDSKSVSKISTGDSCECDDDSEVISDLKKSFFAKPIKKKIRKKKTSKSPRKKASKPAKIISQTEEIEQKNELQQEEISQDLKEKSGLDPRDSKFSSIKEMLDRGNQLMFEDLETQKPINPTPKKFNRFLSEELPPLPILDRRRTPDNYHIPYITTPKERIDEMFFAISLGSVTLFNEAYKYVQNPNINNDQGDTVLTYAILLRKYPIIASVLAKGADPNLPNKLGHKPVEIAIEMTDFVALELLANNNADLNYVDAFGRTYLMLAARVGFLPAVDLLVKNGVNIDAMDEDGFTALSIAYRHKKEIIVKYLLKTGAKSWEGKPFTVKRENLIQKLQNRWNR